MSEGALIRAVHAGSLVSAFQPLELHVLSSFSPVRPFVTLWKAAYQASPRVNIEWTDDASGGLGTTPRATQVLVRLQIL